MSGKRDRGRVLVVEDEAYVRDSLVAMLEARDYDIVAAGSVDEALDLLAQQPVDVVLSDLRMPGADGLALLERLRETGPEIPVVILTGYGTVASAVACLKAGACDYILKPVDPDALELTLERALSLRSLEREVRYLRHDSARGGDDAVGESPGWKQALAAVDAAARTDATVLILGESGTGKEVLARRLHARSRRAAGPFIRVNCAAVPLEVWESEFFGHRRGAFTGAAEDHDGYFRLAHRGTLLLDEVGSTPAPSQAKFLRAIQEGEFHRVGDRKPTRVDVRIVASTNSDLQADVDAGRFREDLYYRLNVVRIDVAPLRERREDVLVLARRFAREVAGELGISPPEIDAETARRLEAYSWPGNVRELRSVIERALILDPEHGLESLDLTPPPPARRGGSAVGEADLNLRDALARRERELLEEALRRAGSVRKDAAAMLGIDPRNLNYYLRKHGLEPD